MSSTRVLVSDHKHIRGKGPTPNAQRNTVTARRKECVYVRHADSYPGPAAVPVTIGSLMCRELETPRWCAFNGNVSGYFQRV